MNAGCDEPVPAGSGPKPSLAVRLRSFGNLLNLSTPLGLVVARVGRARVRPGPRGTYIAEGYRLRFPIAGAFTVGNVILTAGSFEGERRTCSASTFAHEERHCWQWLALGGLPFLPAYAAAMAWSWLRTGDRAAANVFERLAGLEQGGYCERPRRSVRAGLTDLGRRVSRRPGC